MGGDPIPGHHEMLRKIYESGGAEMLEIEAVIFHLEGLLRDAKSRRDFLISRRAEVKG